MNRRNHWAEVARSPIGVAAIVAMIALASTATIAPMLLDEAATTIDVAAMSQGPSAAHWLGTDALGRDVLSRILVASRTSVLGALAVTGIAATGGLLIGGASAAAPPRLGRLITAAINVAVALPGILLSMFLIMVFGASIRGVVLGLGLALIPFFARLTQTLAASVAGREYIEAARGMGVSRIRIITRHILPNVAEPLAINITISIGGALLAFSALSFLGLGAQPPSYDWGRLLNESLPAIYTQPVAAIGCGLAVILAGASFNLVGDALARALGQRSSRSALRSLITGTTLDIQHAERASIPTVVPVLDVTGLTVRFPRGSRTITPVRGIDLRVGRGESVGLVGESGSGKTLTAMAIAGLVPLPGVVDATRLAFGGVDLADLAPGERRTLLGTHLGVVFQDPRASFNPLIRVGPQLSEVTEVHHGTPRPAALERAVQRLGDVGIDRPRRRSTQYPHEFSGGMLQRAMIGMSLMAEPWLIIADEPTTGLDVTVQRRVLQLLKRTQHDTGAAILLVSHDLAVVSQLCSRVVVMYGGTIVEDLSTVDLVSGRARHPYTRALLAAIPDLDGDTDQPLATIPGSPPAVEDLPAGCPFAARCAFADEECQTLPPLVIEGAARVACWHPQPERPKRAKTSGIRSTKERR
jgi:peptide/nickel transport system permease protein